jgi:predicted RND superfamily exporter protein
MKKPFFARYALIILMIVFFLAPFALRGARMAVQRMKNDVKDWLPSDFVETRELDWFRERFLGEQFVVVSWDGLTGDASDESFMTFVDKFFPEVPPSEKARRLALTEGNDDLSIKDVSGNWPIQVRRADYIDPRLNMYVRQLKVGDLPPAEERLGNKLGLHYEPNKFTNWGGKQEKWIKGRGDQWYYLTPEGEFYRWKGGSSVIQPLISTIRRNVFGAELEGEYIASFGPLDGDWYYQDPDRLSARLFKTVTTGPGVLHQLTRPGGVLDGDIPAAVERLRGSLFGPDGKQTALVVTLTDAAKADLRIAVGRGILGKPRGVLLEMAEESGVHPPAAPVLAPPPISWFLKPAPEPTGPVIKLGGPSVDNVAIDEEGQITLVRLVGLSVVVGVGLAYLSFRSINITIMIFLVGGLSAVGSLSFVYWGGTSVDAVLMSMPSLVYVLGLSGAVHIVNYYRDSLEHVGLRHAAGEAIRLGWKPCTLAAITTSIGLMSLYTSNILPIRKFGLFSAIGVVATLALLFTYLPAALQTWPPRRFRNRRPGSNLKSGLERFLERFWRSAGAIVYDHWIIATSACFLAMLVIGSGLRQIDTDVQLLKMFDQNAKIIRDYRWLEANLGRLVPMEIVVRIEDQYLRDTSGQSDNSVAASPQQDAIALTFLERMEVVDNIQRALEARFGDQGAGLIGHAMSAVTFSVELPGAGGGIRSLPKRGGISRSLEEHRDEFLASDYLRLDPEDQSELWRISLRLGALNDVDYGEFVTDLKATVEPVLAAYRYRDEILRQIQAQRGTDSVRGTSVYLAGAPGFGRSRSAANPLQPSPKAVVKLNAAETQAATERATQSMIFAKTLGKLLLNAGMAIRDWHDPAYELPDNWPAVATQQDAVVVVDPRAPYDPADLQQAGTVVVDARQHFFDPAQGTAEQQDQPVAAIYTGLVPVVYKAQRTLLESLIESTVWAFVMIAIVMVMVVRSVRAGLLSMLPNIFPVVIVFGAMGWGKILVDIGSMMTASVAMGVAVDDTIHFLTWFRRGLDEGLKRRDSILQAYERVGMAMTQTTAIGGLGLSIFAFSTFTPTQRFGTLMLALLATALIGDLIFLPALLASPLGRVFDGPRRWKSKPKSEPTEPPRSSSTAHQRPYPASTQLSQNRSVKGKH